MINKDILKYLVATYGETEEYWESWLNNRRIKIDISRENYRQYSKQKGE